MASEQTSEKSASLNVVRPIEQVKDGSEKASTQPRSRNSTPQSTVIVMSAGLVLGVMAAVGHHLWYRHWNGMAVETASWSQTWIHNFGTAFAFLVKMFLAIVTSTAFVQQFWITVKAKPVAIGQLDSMFTVLNSALQFLNLRLWLDNPVLALLAIVTWLLPLSAIVTPGTLNVVSITTTPILQMQVPQFDFSGKSISFGTSGNDGGPALGASAELQRLTVSAASGLQISQIPFPIANASYQLQHLAPAISCTPAPAPIVKRVVGWLQAVSETASDSPWLCFDPYKLNLVSANYTPFDSQDPLATMFFGSGFNFNYKNESASLVIAMLNNTSSDLSYPIVQCSLYNASYHSDFQFAYPSQNVSVTQRKLLNPTGTQGADFGTPKWAYMNIMDAFADMLVGYSTAYRGGEFSYRTNYKITALSNLPQQDFGNEQLGSVLESIFQNITLSLLSDSSFLQNTTTAQKVTVTVTTPRNIYAYRATQLFLAYGISILVSAACLCLGLVSIRRNAGSYSNDFSTVLRTTRHASLAGVVDEVQATGLAPLGKGLGGVRIVMGEGGEGETGFRVEGWEGRMEDKGSEEALYHPPR